MNEYLFTSESVSEGHPDKICDRISDEIVDLCLNIDENARVACEVLATTNHITLAGEIRGKGITDSSGNIIPSVKQKMIDKVRQTVKDIGYNQDGFHWEKLCIDFRVHGQSPDIAQGVDGTNLGAGDQGIMFGYATNETDSFMPPAIYYSHKILKKLSDLRRSPSNPGFGPDMKSQVTLKFKNHKAIGVDSVVVSAQHIESFKQDEIRKHITSVVNSVFENFKIDEKKLHINPTGRFVIGGPDGDAGLTGRKIIVDTYGGSAPHGGGAFSGKDPTKVDRSAAYVARYLAKNIVGAKICDQCLIQLSYAIGKSEPLAIFVDTFGTGQFENGGFSNSTLINAIRKSIDLSPSGIIEHLKLNRPIYAETSAFGHFGRTPTEAGHFSWEKLDLMDTLKKNIELLCNFSADPLN